jgi:hypothetical protein
MTVLLRSFLVLAMTAAACVAADRPVHHLVMFTWKPETTQAQADAIEQALRALKDQVPGIVSLSYGKQNSPEEAAKKHNFQYGYAVVFANRAARDGYITHPAHVAAVGIIIPHLADVAVVDYDL